LIDRRQGIVSRREHVVLHAFRLVLVVEIIVDQNLVAKR
jgi:hypothetical protein